MFPVFLGKLQNSFLTITREKVSIFLISLVALEIAIKLVRAPAVTRAGEDALSLVGAESVQKPRLCLPTMMIN